MTSDIENKYVIFKLENEFYGINIENVRSIERIQNYTRVPNAPSYVRGVINLRGEVIPIIDLREKLGLTIKEVDNNSRIIIVSVNELIVGLIVDSSSEVLEINKEKVDRPPASEENEAEKYIKGIGKDEKRLIILIDLEKLLITKA